MAEPPRPALPAGRRVEPGQGAREPPGAVDVPPQDRERGGEERGGEQHRHEHHEQATHADRAGVGERRGEKGREPHYDGEPRGDHR